MTEFEKGRAAGLEEAANSLVSSIVMVENPLIIATVSVSVDRIRALAALPPTHVVVPRETLAKARAALAEAEIDCDYDLTAESHRRNKDMLRRALAALTAAEGTK